MKKALTDVKSCVTLLFAFSLVALLFISIFKNESMFETVFLLFTNLCTAVFTDIIILMLWTFLRNSVLL